MQTFLFNYYFSIFVQIKNQLWQNNTETLKIIRQNIYFFKLEGAMLLVDLAALQQFEECLHLVCIFPEAVDHTVVSPHSLKHIRRDEAIGCLFRTPQQQTTFTQYLTDRATEWVIFIHIGTFQMNQKGYLIGWLIWIMTIHIHLSNKNQYTLLQAH